jgi:YidC/Oxa1 family membrane protein insertase
VGLLETMRESSTLGELVARSPELRPVVFYAEDSFTFAQFEGYVAELLDRANHPVLYITSDSHDPLFESAPPGLEVRHLDKQLGRLMARLDGSVVVMTMPDLGQFHVPKPASSLVLYIFHSLNSVHTAYREGAFDHYDSFACTGHHHVSELAAVRSARGAGDAELREVGYYKLDRIARAHDERPVQEGRTPEVLLAPSWGRMNLLEAHGEDIISALLAEGFKVTVRPHPQFFHSLYPEGEGVVKRLETGFSSNQNVTFELSIDTEDSFHRSDVMISDWSGAAFEYALGTLRPVLFIDTPPKIFNEKWEQAGLPQFEREMRQLVGNVVSKDEVRSVGPRVATLVAEATTRRDQLRVLRDRTVFNPGRSSVAGADLIEEMVQRL